MSIYSISSLIADMNNFDGGIGEYCSRIAPARTTFQKLYRGDDVIVSWADNGSCRKFVKEVYSSILERYDISIDDDPRRYNLKLANEEGADTIEYRSVFYKITGFTGNNTGTDSALKVMLNLFKKIGENEDIGDYKIEIENHENDENIDEINDDNGESAMGINNQLDRILGKHKQVILTGAPGTGKTYSAKEYVKSKIQNGDQQKFVQFHPSYDYSDFVEGIRPIEVNGEMRFVKLDGHFKALCREAARAENENKDFYFIVDEINRADLSKVFGELMYGLEEEYRGEKFKTQYNNLPSYNSMGEKIENDIFRDGFYIPNNVYIIGTMNDIDRSVESFDFALRRRFQWYEVKANDVMKDVIESKFIKYLQSQDNNQVDVASNDNHVEATETQRNAIDFIVNQMKEMNKRISTEGARFGLNESYHIGPAYVAKDDVMEEIYRYDNAGNIDGSRIIAVLSDKFENNIKPLLKEYVRGRNGAVDFISNVKSALITYQNDVQENNDQNPQDDNQDEE